MQRLRSCAGTAVNECVVESTYPSLELWSFFHQSEDGATFSVVVIGPSSGPDSGLFMQIALNPLKSLEQNGWRSTIVSRGSGDEGAVKIISNGHLVPLADISFAGVGA